MDIESCKSLLTHYIPMLKVTNINPVQQGWDSFTVEVNHEFIFRFATRPDVYAQYMKEAWLLPILASRLQLKVPEPLFVKLNLPPPFFIGYKLIPGSPLRAADIAECGFNNYSDQLGNFLKSLRAFPIQEAQTHMPILESDNWRRRYVGFNENIHNRLRMRIEDSVLREVDAVFESFLSNRGNFTFKPALIHGDLSSDHILHDKAAGSLTGVIDWGDSVFGDPAFDLTGLLSDYGSSFCDSVLQGVSQSDSMLLRAEFYLRLIPFYEALHGLEVGDRATLEEGLKLISKNFRNSP
jgi:aminoglycoside 2''-phosphotransferase